MSFLVDTNVVSELRKGDRTDPGVRSWYERCEDEKLFLSVLVVGELRRGIESIRRRDVDSATALDRWFRELVSAHSERLLVVNREVAEAWGRLSVPNPLPAIDGLLAATAIVHGLTLVTRNTRDVEACGVDLMNPFETA